MKIAFNRQPRRSPWGGGAHFATTFADYLVAHGHEVVYTLQPDIDWIIMLDPRAEQGGFAVGDIQYYKHINPQVKVLHRINDTGKTRGGDELDRVILGSNIVVADYTVFISNWVRDYFVSKGFDITKPNSVINNGCESKFFYPKSRHDFRIPMKLVTHHWSTNNAKGVDLYQHIDDLIGRGAPLEFTYIGRPSDSFRPKYTKIITPLYGEALGDELRKHDVYVTAARWEACGSHHVEGAACGLPVVYHEDGGGVCEMTSRYGVGITNIGEFQAALTKVKNDYTSYYNQVITTDLSAKSMCDMYFNMMK